MKRILVFLVCFPLVTGITFGQEKQPDELLKNAIYQEEVKGNLESAILIYTDIIKKYPKQRAIVVEALFHLGLSNEKLGNKKAKEYYETIVNNFGDQPEFVGIAQKRLSSLRRFTEKVSTTPITPKFTKINIPTKLSPASVRLSPDGKNLTFVSDKKLWKMPVHGNLGPEFSGIPVQINTEDIDVLNIGLSWSGNGKWIAFNENINQDLKNKGIYIVSSTGGKPKKIIETNRGNQIINYSISLSPDGDKLAYSSVEDKKQYIYSISVDGSSHRQLSDMEAREPVFSPDGKMIAFVEDKNAGTGSGDLGLWIVSSNNGTPHLIAKAEKASIPVWSHDSKKIAFLDNGKQINIIHDFSDGVSPGKVTTIDVPEGIEEVVNFAGWTPDNKIGALLRTKVEFGLYTLPAKGGQPAIVLSEGNTVQPRWSPDSKKIYYINDQKVTSWTSKTLGVVSAEGGKGKLIPLRKDLVLNFPYQYQAGNRISPDGKLIISAATASKELVSNKFPCTQIWKIPVDGGTPTQITNPNPSYGDLAPSWSPNGNQVAFLRFPLSHFYGKEEDSCAIYVLNINDKIPKLLLKGKNVLSPVWSPDAKMIAYLSDQDDKVSSINVVNVINGESHMIVKIPKAYVHTDLAWSPDSKSVAFLDNKSKVVKIVSLSDGSIDDVKTNLPDVKLYHLDWSPDGERFVFGGLKDGEEEFWFLEDFLPLDKLAQKKEKEDALLRQKAEQCMKDGKKLFDQWEFEAAIKEYENVINLNPNTLLAQNAQYYIGQSWFRKGNYEESLEAFNTLVKENPESIIAPVTELMIEQVQYAKENKMDSESIINFSDENTIVDSETGITYSKLKTFTGKNDLIRYTTGGFNMSPDGRFLVLENKVVPIDGSDPFSIVDMEALRAVYSPDMKKAVFYADSAIWTVPVSPETGRSMGQPEKLLNGNYKYQSKVSWYPDGEKLAFMRIDKTTPLDIWTISVIDGKLSPLTKSKELERSPAWSPDGKSITYQGDKNGIWLASVSNNNKKLLINNSGNPCWAPDNNWLFHSNSGNTYMYSFSTSKSYRYLFPEPIIGDFIGFSPNGRKMHFYKPSYENKWRLKVVSITGGPSFSLAPNHDVYDARWSIDSKLFLTLSEKKQGEYIFKSIPLSGEFPLNVLIDIDSNEDPFPIGGSPELSKLAFWLPGKENTKDLYIAPFSATKARTTGPAHLVFESWNGGPYNVNFSWSPDGTKLALIHNGDIWVVPVENGNPIQITNTPEVERWVNWSPDGKMIAYLIQSNITRVAYVIPATGGTPQIVHNNCVTGNWGPDGKSVALLASGEIFIVSLTGKKLKHIVNLKDLGLTDTSSPKYSPDGKHLAFIGFYDDDGDKSIIFTYSFENKKITRIAAENPDDNKYSLDWSPDGKWLSYLTNEEEKVRPEGILWEANFEEVKEHLISKESNH